MLRWPLTCAEMATNDEFSLQLIQGESCVGAAKSPVGAAGACVGGGNVPPFCKNRSPKSKVFLCGRPQRMWVGSREPKVSFVVAPPTLDGQFVQKVDDGSAGATCACHGALPSEPPSSTCWVGSSEPGVGDGESLRARRLCTATSVLDDRGGPESGRQRRCTLPGKARGGGRGSLYPCRLRRARGSGGRLLV